MLKNLARTLDPETDAIDLLKSDHRKVEGLFAQFKSAQDKRTKTSVGKQICQELDVHAKIEEKVFYPTSKREADEAEDEIDEGIVEHEGIKRLVKQLSQMSASDDLYEARMTVLEEYVKHHVKEEETSMFPKIAESDLDLKALGARLLQEKEKLQGGGRSSGRSRSASASRRSSSRNGRATRGGASRSATMH
ncbi:MAG TPA: hemerythrin domain-containing protein [Nevskiaceae bacterium]|nr:hemerythrin domain-containing protein [Nevskiaceae bacterium]